MESHLLYFQYRRHPPSPSAIFFGHPLCRLLPLSPPGPHRLASPYSMALDSGTTEAPFPVPGHFTSPSCCRRPSPLRPLILPLLTSISHSAIPYSSLTGFLLRNHHISLPDHIVSPSSSHRRLHTHPSVLLRPLHPLCPIGPPSPASVTRASTAHSLAQWPEHPTSPPSLLYGPGTTHFGGWGGAGDRDHHFSPYVIRWLSLIRQHGSFRTLYCPCLQNTQTR